MSPNEVREVTILRGVTRDRAPVRIGAGPSNTTIAVTPDESKSRGFRGDIIQGCKVPTYELLMAVDAGKKAILGKRERLNDEASQPTFLQV